MRTRAIGWLVSAVLLVVAFGGPASGSGPEPSGQMPYYFFDWDDVAAADAPPRATLQSAPGEACTGHVRTHIALAPGESGVKSLTLAPVEGEECVFEVQARAYDVVEGREYETEIDAMSAGCCTHTAQDPEGQTAAPKRDSAQTFKTSGTSGVAAAWCRLGEGWAHTGYPDPPTVIYTRIYQQIDLCYSSQEAWVDSYSGVCFANQAYKWYTDPDQCDWTAQDLGPSPSVFLTLHGYFEKDTGSQTPPVHEMWHTINGESGNGRVHCTGDIVGEYDGYARTNNCGATSPEPLVQ